MENLGAWLLIAGAIAVSALPLSQMLSADSYVMVGYWAVAVACCYLYGFWVWLKFCQVRPEPPAEGAAA
jgi:hypothetical protein